MPYDRAVKLVGRIRIVAPARILVSLGISAFGDQIAARPAKSAAAVPSSQSALQRLLDRFLQRQIKRRVDLQAPLIKILNAEFLVLLDVLPNLFGEIAAHLRRLFLEGAEDDGSLDRLLVLLAIDVVLRQHATEDEIAAIEGVVGMIDRTVVAAAMLKQSRDRRRLGQCQIFRVLAEIKA